MDIALAVEEIYPAADYRRADSYQALVDTWHDARKIPTESELQTAWAAVQARQATETENHNALIVKLILAQDKEAREKLTQQEQINLLFDLVVELAKSIQNSG